MNDKSSISAVTSNLLDSPHSTFSSMREGNVCNFRFTAMSKTALKLNQFPIHWFCQVHHLQTLKLTTHLDLGLRSENAWNFMFTLFTLFDRMVSRYFSLNWLWQPGKRMAAMVPTPSYYLTQLCTKENPNSSDSRGNMNLYANNQVCFGHWTPH
jgi:hypothetical protein